jgi:glycosyltransferase involved in cell wall biosynthesis
LKEAAAIVPVSSSLKKIAVELGAQPSRIHVLPNGIDASRFPIISRRSARRKLELPEEARILAYVGALRRVKGPDLLVDAVEILKHSRPDLIAVAAGTGPRHRAIQRRINRLGLHDRIRLVGQLPPEEVATLMNAADALVLPSRNEGCPNAVLESLSCGTPVVAARVGAVPDLLDDTCGLQVEPGHSLKLARAIQTSLAKDWDREAIRGHVKKRSCRKNAEQLDQILLHAIEKVPEESPQKRSVETITHS